MYEKYGQKLQYLHHIIKIGVTKMQNTQYKNPSTAAVLSFLFIGLGQIYNGKLFDAIILWGIQAIAVTVAFSIPWLIVCPIIIWILNIYDAQTSAERINKLAVTQ